jgi:hypothetical protein
MSLARLVISVATAPPRCSALASLTGSGSAEVAPEVAGSLPGVALTSVRLGCARMGQGLGCSLREGREDVAGWEAAQLARNCSDW